MSEVRYSINNDRMFIEAPATRKGKRTLEGIRKLRRVYKGRHITRVIQTMPAQIRFYREYRIRHEGGHIAHMNRGLPGYGGKSR